MSFWDLSDGGKANENVKDEFQLPGGNMEPIPNNSDCLATIKAVKWTTSGEGAEEVRYIDLQWQVEAPAVYKSRVIFQKIWADDLNPNAKTRDAAIKKRDNARKMLATIDDKAAGKMMRDQSAPTDDSMALALVGYSMVIKIMLWEMPDDQNPGQMRRGNWISAIKSKDAPLSEGEPLPPMPSGSNEGGRPSNGGGNASAPSRSFDLDDDIPFGPEVRV